MAVIYTADFENVSDFDEASGGFILSGTSDAARSSEQALLNTYSCKTELAAFTGTNATDFRCELANFKIHGSNQFWNHNTEYWLGFAIYVPSTYHNSDYGDLVWQMHNQPFGYAWQRASFSLQIQRRRFDFTRRSTVVTSTTGRGTETELVKDCGAVNLDAWNYIVLNFRLGTDANAKTCLWVNGTQYFDELGIPNTVSPMYSGGVGFRPYMKAGLYSWVRKDPGNSSYPGDSNSALTLYHDAFRVGDATSNYAEVHPTGGTEPGGSATSIDNINTTNEIIASTAVNTINGGGLSGAYDIAITDGTDSASSAVKVFGDPDGTKAYFNTDALTDIDNPANVIVSYATPDYDEVDPYTSAWSYNAESAITRSQSLTAYGPFTEGLVVTSNASGVAWGRTNETLLTSVTTGDVCNFIMVFVAGTGNKVMCELRQSGGAGLDFEFEGTIGSLAIDSNTLSNGTHSATEFESPSYPGLRFVLIQFESAITGDIIGGIGPFSATQGDSVDIRRIIAWKNRAESTILQQVTIPALLPEDNTAPVFSSVGALTSGQAAAANLTNPGAVIAAVVTDGSTTAQVTDWVASTTSSAAFTAPYGMPTVNAALRVDWAPAAAFTKDAVNWGDNSSGLMTISAYDGSSWAGAGAYIASGGIAWHRSSEQMIYANAGEVVKGRFRYIQGNSGSVGLSMRNESTGENIVVSGSVDNLAITNDYLGTNQSFTETEVNGVREVVITFTNPVAGWISMGIGPNTDTDGANVIGFSKQAWTNRDNASVSYNVTVASSLHKRVKFNVSGKRLRRSGTLFTGTFDHFKLFDSDPLLNSDAKELAHAENLTATAGVMTVNHEDLTSGSLNSLAASTDYWFYAFDEDKDPFAFGQIQITIE